MGPGSTSDDADPEGRDLDAQRVGHRFEGVLGRAVGRGEGHRDPARDRGDIDDRPARRPRAWHGRTARVTSIAAEEVDVELGPPLLGRDLLDGAVLRVSRVVDQGVDAAGRAKRPRPRPGSRPDRSRRGSERREVAGRSSSARSLRLRAVAKTRCPRRAASRAVARPMPEEQPVTRITCARPRPDVTLRGRPQTARENGRRSHAPVREGLGRACGVNPPGPSSSNRLCPLWR